MTAGRSSRPRGAGVASFPLIVVAVLAAAGASLALAACPGGPTSIGDRLARVTAPGPARTARAPQAPAAPPASSMRPRVRLMATGGTISNRGDRRLTAEELIASVPGLGSYVRAEGEQFRNVQSTELSLDDFLRLSRRIGAVLRGDPDLGGVVVSAGTDTLEELAYFLHLTVRDRRPVVVVGAMRHPGSPGYEGAANLLAAFRVAGDPVSRGMGALVVLNDEIHSARDVRKADAVRLDAFDSGATGALGVVDADRVVYYRRPLRRFGPDSEFDIETTSRLPRVDILLVYQDAPGDLIRASVDAGARGLVIAAAGAGAVSSAQRDGLVAAADRGVVVVFSTRTGGGRVARGDLQGVRGSSATGTPPPLAAEDLSPVKARLLLALGLTRTTDRTHLQRLFDDY
jgi:L-asparaginase